jgi:hypothetical protein
MNRLYGWWVGFLQDSFNEPMYASFKKCAEEDAAAGFSHGLTCLCQFYAGRLATQFDAGAWRLSRAENACRTPLVRAPGIVLPF